MKKTVLSGIVILAIAAVAAFNVNFNAQKSDLSGVSLANVEALAWGELTKNGWTCFQNVRDDGGSLWLIVTYCGNCSSYSATSVIGSGLCWFNN